MYIEKRKEGKNVKYYLTHSYRDINNKVKKIRKYLGFNLNSINLKQLIPEAENFILDKLNFIGVSVFDFILTKKQIESLNKLNSKIKIVHFTSRDWELFTEDFVYNTNAIEGSTVLKNEIHNILQKKNLVDEDEMETKGVANALDYLRNTKQDLSINLILKLHKICFHSSKDYAGELRNVEVVIKNKYGKIIHMGTPVKDLKKELNLLINWYNINKGEFKPLVIAAIVHNQFEDIHPFQDGNGRVGRLLLNHILIKNNYPPINILLEDRAEYYYVLQEYQKNDKLRPTLNFLIKQYKKTLKNVSTKK